MAHVGSECVVKLTFIPAPCYRSCCSLVIWHKCLSREEATCRQHTKASAFAEPFMWKFPANRKQWDIAIADHADPVVGSDMTLASASASPTGLQRWAQSASRDASTMPLSGRCPMWLLGF